MGIYDGFKFKPAKWLPSKHLSLEDLERLRNLPREEMEYVNENGYQVKLVRNPGMCAMMDMFYRIVMSDVNDTKLTMICPNPWAIRYLSLVEMINKFGISCRNVHAFAMDEFADEDGNVCPNTYAPVLGYSFMNNFYGRIRDDLRPDVSQWHTFNYDVKERGVYSRMIEDCGGGGADVIYSATGWPGHIAFIDPDTEEFKADSLEEFIPLKSGLVTQNPMSTCENSLFSQVGKAGDCWAVPPRAATIGPSDVVNARERVVVHDCLNADGSSWQKMITRIENYGPISKECPSSIVRLGKGTCYMLEGLSSPIKCWFSGMQPKDV